jgi:ABC-type bacteriocin/lantibiotic exporter with double-glycine peptidase domain
MIIGISMPIILALSKAYFKKMKRLTHKVKETESAINSFLQESLSRQTVIKVFERQNDELNKLSGFQNRLQKIAVRRINISILTNSLMYLAFSGSYVTAFIWSAWSLTKKLISFGTVTAYLQLVSRMQTPLLSLAKTIPSVIATKTASERLAALTEFESEKIENKLTFTNEVTLKIENLTFSYNKKGKMIINDFSLTANPGDVIAIMGETGVGKTTLLRLLLALLPPDSGTISLENANQKILVSENARSNFVYVPQGSSLFSGSIRDNVLMGNPKADDTEIRNVLHTASADFVFDLPNGIDTLIGEKGSYLSEGQAQRIAIARSLLRPGKILLLDEATSALDAKTEATFIDNLKRQLGNRIVLFITHHKEVAKRCDKVVQI